MKSEIGKRQFKERLATLIGDEKPFPWAARIGISPATFSRMWNEGIPPKADTLIRIAEETGASIDWLLRGEGTMKSGLAPTEEKASESEEIGTTGSLINQDEFTLVPRYDVRASCGGGAMVESEQIVDHLAFKRKWVKMHGLQADCLALISAKGDSMEPTIKDGYLLLVDLRQQEIKADAIYVLRIDHELVAKRCQKLFTGDLKIKSDNPAYDEQVVPADQKNKLDIIGRVVWGGGKM